MKLSVKLDALKVGQVEKIIKTVKLDITGFSGGATPRNCLNFNSILTKVETLMSGGNKIIAKSGFRKTTRPSRYG